LRGQSELLVAAACQGGVNLSLTKMGLMIGAGAIAGCQSMTFVQRKFFMPGTAGESSD
jgi:hypothetical protein